MQTENDGRNDFNFFIGNWTVKHRKLKELLKNCAEWDEFESTVVDRAIMGGIGNLEEMIFERTAGRFYGTSLSIFNPKTKQWSQYWVDSANATLQDPMIGKFTDGVGEFFSEDEFEGRTVLARARWYDIEENSCKWEQSLSDDGGQTWETNWVMEFIRA
ncbi:MAG TPA: hypothetical protein PKE35_10660 [Anaerolineales bacterium]|nr:hypothetical protein [Anaerolineales bacterium]HMV95787.1 hypothetical protein [Anaerolineales bacterium]HMX74707.1 hypothetical protein [Anaerolineales bacterium]HMZ43562.1 hypothetical protein [Anaerolineales bacterium]HNA55243.1 hypothetical protein [Anaerolineales bacterium]